MKRIIIVLILITALSGCAGFRGYVVIRENKKDIVGVKKQGLPFNKKNITGKGAEFWTNKETDFEYSIDKDGKHTWKFSTKKDSIWTKVWGAWKMLKPNNVELGGR